MSDPAKPANADPSKDEDAKTGQAFPFSEALIVLSHPAAVHFDDN